MSPSQTVGAWRRGRAPWSDDSPIRIGISSCLLGAEVRHDGGHKRDRLLAEIFGQYVEWVAVCPEVEVGMGVPREPIRLVRRGGEVRLLAERSGKDHTRSMRAWARRRVRELERLDLCGYVLKKSSPSCGMERVRVYGASGLPPHAGRGLFAAALIERFPRLPVEEEGRLGDLALRENFIERIFAYHRLGSLFRGHWTVADLARFHTAHELQLMAHSAVECAQLHRLVVKAKGGARAALREQYAALFMQALGQRATRRRHASVLRCALGHLGNGIDRRTRAELLGLIADYRAGLVPLIVPITLVRHCARTLAIEYLAHQVYLHPHPKELMLRNYA